MQILVLNSISYFLIVYDTFHCMHECPWLFLDDARKQVVLNVYALEIYNVKQNRIYFIVLLNTLSYPWIYKYFFQ